MASRLITAASAIKDIEEGTDDGREIVAVWGMGLAAKTATPEFFKKKAEAQQ